MRIDVHNIKVIRTKRLDELYAIMGAVSFRITIGTKHGEMLGNTKISLELLECVTEDFVAERYIKDHREKINTSISKMDYELHKKYLKIKRKKVFKGK